MLHVLSSKNNYNVLHDILTS